MKTYKLEDIRKKNLERRGKALEAARRVDPDFYLGKRVNRFYGRKDKEKGKVLEELYKKEQLMKEKSFR